MIDPNSHCRCLWRKKQDDQNNNINSFNDSKKNIVCFCRLWMFCTFPPLFIYSCLIIRWCHSFLGCQVSSTWGSLCLCWVELGWFGWRRIWAFLRGTWLTYEVNKLLIPCVQKCILGTDPHHHRASIWRLKELNLPVMLTMSETLHRNMRYFVVINYQKILPQHMIVILGTTEQYSPRE